MRKAVLQPDFLQDNYLSNEKRVSIAKVKTNACAAVATNATKDHIWEAFSSDTYKAQPAVGEIDVYNPIDGTSGKYSPPGGGPGYLRVPSLVGIWATAPFFHNNALGKYTGDPSVPGRMEAFNDAIEKLLWPEKRLGKNSVYRTSEESYLKVYKDYVPWYLSKMIEDDYLTIGPIPKGTPVNLLANIDLNIADPVKTGQLLKVAIKVKKDFRRIKSENLSPEQSAEVLKNVVPDLLKLSKCPDFITDRGHEFGTDLADADKRALIEFLKTL
jgi:hypothetical protein